jgi:hypothetical protein
MDKLRSLHDAIATDVQDGMSIAMGCALESLIPFAASHEIIRQKKSGLTLIGPISDMQFDQLIGPGCVKKIIASWVGNVAAGLGHNHRRAAELDIPRSKSIPISPSVWRFRPLRAACPICRRDRSKAAILLLGRSFVLSLVRSPAISCSPFAPFIPT